MRAVVLLCLLEAALVRGSDYSWDTNDGVESNDTATVSSCSLSEGNCGCCLMLQQTDGLKTHFNTSLNELESIYSQTNQALDHIESKRSAFSVALFSDFSLKCYESLTDNKIIVYKHVFLNMGNDYNENTGIYTVPYPGVYSVAVTVYSDAGVTDGNVDIFSSLRVNDQVVATARDINTDDHEDSSSIVMAIHLNASDKLDVILHSGHSICDDGHFNTFSAFLLYKD